MCVTQKIKPGYIAACKNYSALFYYCHFNYINSCNINWMTSLQWRQQVPVSNERRKFYQNFQGNTQQELLNLIKPTLWIPQLHQNDDDRTPAEITRQLWHILSPLRCGQQGRQQWRTGRRHCRTPRSPTTQQWLWTPTPN